MDSQVQEVKSKTDIVSIIGERIELKKAGRNFKANCPFHGEKTASFMVSPELQIFKCFGCSESGDVYSFLEKYEGMEFPEALKYLADRAGIKLVKNNFNENSDREKLIQIHEEAIKFYTYALTKHPLGKKAYEYLLTTRGLKKETIEEFQIGYSPENSYIINDYLINKKKFNAEDIEKSGIGVVNKTFYAKGEKFVGEAKNFYDRFNGRVMFPLFDHRGNPVGFSGRVLPWDKRDTGKYINSPETPIYHKSNMLYGLNLTRSVIKKKKVAIVVEGELDLISSYQAGIKNVVAIKGSALTEEQVKLLSRFAPKFILALDADFAGDAAARRGITIAQNSGVEIKVAKITGFKDPDEAARGNLESYKKDLIHSEGVWDFLIDSVFVRFNSQTGEGKAKISKELIPIIGGIEDKIVQAHYANLLAEKLRVPLDAVAGELQKAEPKEEKSDSKTQEVIQDEKEPSRYDLLEQRFLILSFQSNPLQLIDKNIASLIQTPIHIKIIKELETFLTINKTFDAGLFGEKLPKELFDAYSYLVFGENQDLLDKPDELKKELDLVKKELTILSVKEKLELIAQKMREFEKNGDQDKLLKAQGEYATLTKNLASIKAARVSGIILSEDN